MNIMGVFGGGGYRGQTTPSESIPVIKAQNELKYAHDQCKPSTFFLITSLIHGLRFAHS